MIQGKPCFAWIVEFTAGVVDAHKRKILLTAVDVDSAKVKQIIDNHWPNTRYIFYNVDSAIITLPHGLMRSDFVYQPDGRAVDQDGKYQNPADLSPEPVFFDDDENVNVIIIKPPEGTHNEFGDA